VTCEDIDPTENLCNHLIEGGFCTLPDKFRCEEWLKSNSVSLSFSAIRSFAQCHRRFYWAYIEGLERIDKPIRMLMGEIASKCLRDIHEFKGDQLSTILAEYQGDEEVTKELAALMGSFLAYREMYSDIKGKAEYEFKWKEDELTVHGFVDLANKFLDDGLPYHGWEFKYTNRPGNYSKFNLSSQLGTYFLGVPTLKVITVRLIQVPELRPAKDETMDEYSERVYQDVKRRPKHYINDTKYWREEFNYEEIKFRIKRIVKDIKNYAKLGMKSYYQNEMACFWPSQCDYYNICESGVVSESLYKRRDK